MQPTPGVGPKICNAGQQQRRLKVANVIREIIITMIIAILVNPTTLYMPQGGKTQLGFLVHSM